MASSSPKKGGVREEASSSQKKGEGAREEASSSQKKGEGAREEDDDEPTKLFKRVSVCIVSDDAKELNELISSNKKTWDEASLHEWSADGNKGHTLLSYALLRGSPDCAVALMGWGCVPDEAMRETSGNIMAEDEVTVVRVVEKRIVKGYENLFDWQDVERAQEILIDMYDHGLSATVEEVKDALSAYYLDPANATYINDQSSWISSKPTPPLSPPTTIIIKFMFLDFDNNTNNTWGPQRSSKATQII